MKKQGFTLVELLGVISVLAILLIAISVPVTKGIRDANVSACNNQLDMVISSAKLWGKENYDQLPAEIGDKKSIYLDDLINASLFDEESKNPKTNEKLENMEVVIEKTGKKRWSYSLNISSSYCED
jgi:prepilin-type N-terminal cleavage/methylation domain